MADRLMQRLGVPIWLNREDALWVELWDIPRKAEGELYRAARRGRRVPPMVTYWQQLYARAKVQG